MSNLNKYKFEKGPLTKLNTGKMDIRTKTKLMKDYVNDNEILYAYKQCLQENSV